MAAEQLAESTDPAPLLRAGLLRGTETPVGTACRGEGGEAASGVWQVLGWGAVLAAGLGCAWEGLHLLVQSWGAWQSLSQLSNVTFLVRCALGSPQSAPASPKVQSVCLAG